MHKNFTHNQLFLIHSIIFFIIQTVRWAAVVFPSMHWVKGGESACIGRLSTTEGTHSVIRMV